MQHYVDVILPIPLQQHFTYKITEAEANFLKPGMRIAVPFGKRKIYTALVITIHTNAPIHYEAKEIHEILDKQPIVNNFQLQHWKWIADYYMCTLGEVFRTAIPTPFLLESETLIEKNNQAEIDESLLQDDEFLLVEALKKQSVLKIDEVQDILDKKTVLPVINKLFAKGVIKLKENVVEQYKPKLVKYVKLHDKYSDETLLHALLDDLSRAPKQKEMVMQLFMLNAKTKKPIKLKELQQSGNFSAAITNALVQKQVIEVYEVKTDRIGEQSSGTLPSKSLNNFQQEALNSIQQNFKQERVVLLHGITSSGKTEIYVKLIEEQLKQQKQVLYLVPEIALTTQLINRLQQYFSGSISVFHSKYSQNERVEVWNNVLQNKDKAQIILGARSALFLPFSNLGLIIVDEEHEPSYRQHDPAPRYHARDAAIVLATLQNKCNVLLGSATPAIESYYNAKNNKYALVELNRRYGNVLEPDIELVDLKDKTRRKQVKGHFSDRLLEEINQTLQEGEQVILFQNRRGYAPIIECTTCGHVPQCTNCDVSLTYHQYRNQLRCHYCGYFTAVPQQCWACSSNTLNTKGFGTEQIEQECKKLFPGYKVARMDLDTTRGKHGYEKILTAFQQQEIDILVGTQMLSKGLDFRKVQLVGVLNADNLLHFPDFRAHERTFQMLVQVAGRAGRTQKRGKVIIQTYNPYHQILQQVTTSDYFGMYTDQINDRIQFKYPPIHRIIKITFKAKDFNRLNEGAAWFTKSLRQVFGDAVLGPEAPPVGRIRNFYLKNTLLKLPKNKNIAQCKTAVLRVHKSFNAIAHFKSIRVVYHVDYF